MRITHFINTNPKTLFRYIRGSHAHGIATERSDVDHGGVFLMSNETLLTINPDIYKDEIADGKHDDTMWELNKFGRLLTTSNPTVLESLFVDKEFIEYVHPAFKEFIDRRDIFLTQECFKPFGHYAAAQIRKARGLNKMINQPILKRATPIDFCFVQVSLQVHDQEGDSTINDTIPLNDWLFMKHLEEPQISLAKLNHARDAYAIFEHPGGVCRENANDVHCTDIPKGMTSIGTLFFNKDAYTIHCKAYKSQKEWEQKRNPVRYESNLGKSYDAKNMSECIRLVRTCTEIANGDTYHVNRKDIDGDFLLKVRAHAFEYDELMAIANEDVKKMEDAIANTSIHEAIDKELVEDMVLYIRRNIGNF